MGDGRQIYWHDEGGTRPVDRGDMLFGLLMLLIVLGPIVAGLLGWLT